MAKFDPHSEGAELLDNEFNPYQEGASVTQDLVNQAQQQSMASQIPNQRKMLMQEQFSNPTQMPGFANLPKQQQLEQIKFSQFDPANLTPTGGFVPPGSYEQPGTRMAASIAPTLMAPELSMGGPLIRGTSNALSRIGAGTAGNLAYEAPNINSLEELGKKAKGSAALNAVLEGVAAPFRASGQIAELFNPKKYAHNLSQQIRNEGIATKAVMEQEYKPVNDLYNDFPVTVTPEKYLKDAGIKRSQLLPDAKLIYDEFLEKPIYKNLQRFQSKLGDDWARSVSHPTTQGRAQLFAQMQDRTQGKLRNFLSRDPVALAQYDKATNYAKNVHYPYLATPTLRDIQAGTAKIEPTKLSESIRIGAKKTIGKENRKLIPEEHPLRNHLKNLENKISRGNVMQVAIPGALGATIGEYAYPGGGGAIGGGLAGSALGKVGAKFGSNALTSMIQEPYFQDVMNFLSPLYYGGGRGIIEGSQQ
ncbi:MAG: hypothetical protein Q8936_14285 [Bacillota bacterium]|nr:hypothetical protein [Bacillota bacterium]